MGAPESRLDQTIKVGLVVLFALSDVLILILSRDRDAPTVTRLLLRMEELRGFVMTTILTEESSKLRKKYIKYFITVCEVSLRALARVDLALTMGRLVELKVIEELLLSCSFLGGSQFDCYSAPQEALGLCQ